MCELFAISSNYPTSVTFSLAEFSKHGGLMGPHKDGWGIAFYADKDAQIIKEANSASDSECLKFVRNHHIQSKYIISHIRKATQGEIAVENTQPFSRELGGRMHVFAHNGDLYGITNDKKLKHSIAHPMGNTDSEYAFCSLMNLLNASWNANQAPSIQERIDLVAYFSSLIRAYGPANFIYSDSELLFAHGHKRTHNDERNFRPPGLHVLPRTCLIDIENKPIISGLDIQPTQIEQKVILVASVPLSTESWQPLDEGELIVLKDGAIIKSVKHVS
ncbi:MAG: class II glutamine amidotransferase [Gammaproteobacteria bacterium]